MEKKNEIIVASSDSNGRKSVSRLLIAACVVGVLSVFWVPTGVVLLILALGVFFVATAKFIRDNSLLIQSSGSQFFVSFGITLLCFLPVVFVVLPGVYIGYLGGQFLDYLISLVDSIASGTPVTRTVLVPTTYIPWYAKPLEWIGLGPLVSKVKMVETEISTIAHASIWQRLIAGVLRTPLLVLSYFINLWTVMLFVRAFSSLFARVFVALNAKPKFQISNTEVDTEAFNISAGERYTISPQKFNLPFYYRRSALPTGAAPNAKLFIDWKSALPRIFAGFSIVNQIDTTAMQSEAIFSGEDKTRFVEIKLREEQKVIVDERKLLGFTRGVNFRTKWTLNLCQLALKRARNLVLSGLGTVVLQIDGNPEWFTDAESAPSIHSDRLICWTANSVLEITGSQGILNYYFSDCHIQPVKGNLFLYAPPPSERNSKRYPIWKFIIGIYKPF